MWGQGKRRETEEEKAANILSPQMYGVLSDVHMPKTLIHSYKHTHTHARAHAHTSMQCDGHFARGRKGGGHGRLTFQTCKEGAGSIVADGLHLGPQPNHPEKD